MSRRNLPEWVRILSVVKTRAEGGESCDLLRGLQGSLCFSRKCVWPWLLAAVRGLLVVAGWECRRFVFGSDEIERMDFQNRGDWP